MHERWKHCAAEREQIRIIVNIKLSEIRIASMLFLKIMD